MAADRLDDVAGDVLARLAAGDDVVVEIVARGAVGLPAFHRLARLVLAARRLPGDLQLRPACQDVRRLAVLTGFCAALPFEGGSGEPEGEAEPLEDLPTEVLEEVVDVRDAPG